MATTSPFDHAINTATIWLTDIADALGTSDRHLAYRATRAWLHIIRDRLIAESAAKFAAQLPELMRGTFFEGWEPSRVPVKYGLDGFMQRFAAEAGIGATQAPAAAMAVTGVLAARMSPGQMRETLAGLPAELRSALLGDGQVNGPGRDAAPRRKQPDGSDRLGTVENQINSLTDAVRTLARSLENGNVTGIDTAEVARAARLADEILIGAGT